MAALLSGCGSGGQVEDTPSPAAPTPTFSVADAKWEGRWQFDYTLVKLDGVGEGETDFTLGARIRRIWEVAPGCEDGPCNSVITATDPDQPDVEPSKLVVVYDPDATAYRVTQSFPPDPGQACLSGNGRTISSAFESTNVVEVKPTGFDAGSGLPLVTELVSTKTTTYTPVGAAATAGGSCVVKTAVWEGPVTRIGG